MRLMNVCVCVSSGFLADSYGLIIYEYETYVYGTRATIFAWAEKRAAKLPE